MPHHKGMSPYGQLAFQWSCHTQHEPNAPLEHREYLNTDPRWPNQIFAQTLREAVGDDGTLLVWSPFERRSEEHTSNSSHVRTSRMPSSA